MTFLQNPHRMLGLTGPYRSFCFNGSQSVVPRPEQQPLETCSKAKSHSRQPLNQKLWGEAQQWWNKPYRCFSCMLVFENHSSVHIPSFSDEEWYRRAGEVTCQDHTASALIRTQVLQTELCPPSKFMLKP